MAAGAWIAAAMVSTGCHRGSLPGVTGQGGGAGGSDAGVVGSDARDAGASDGGGPDTSAGGGAGGTAVDGGAGGGAGAGDGGAPAIPGLVSLTIAPPTQTVSLLAVGSALAGSATYTAMGTFNDGTTEDVSARVAWPSAFRSLRVQAGIATVTTPGTYTITASSGSVMATATLVATFRGDRFAAGFDPAWASLFSGTPAAAATIAYPLDHAVIPPNLGPVSVHITRTGAAQTAARINFSSESVVNVNYYAVCQPGAGSGCYVDLPAALTLLFIAASETHDITLTARVAGEGAPLLESAPIQVAWANVPLSGGLYYWTTLADGAVPGYRSPRNTDGSVAQGSAIVRYAFDGGGFRPELVYSDQGRSPTFYGSPPATADNAQCIGCHALTNDGRTMALAIGGSAASDFALLDLTTLTMTVLDAPAAGAAANNPMDINYYKQFRKAGIATETAFGPNGDVMVNMYRSGLTLRGTTASLTAQGFVVPSFNEYKTDPFWSQSGNLFVFTSFAQPDVGIYNPTGLTGDMKRGGQIVIATAGSTAIHDDARVLVPRQPNVTSYYPAVSHDDRLVVYVQSACGVDPDIYTDLSNPQQPGVYGSQTCDGYDDSTARLWITNPPDGTLQVRLDAANGAGSTNDNSWPRWSPTGGLFRGQPLYWLVFSSRRPYGLQLNTGAPLTTKAQLWFAAVVAGNTVLGDPSFQAVWLPNQNPLASGSAPNQVPTDNHVPQWVKTALPLPN